MNLAKRISKSGPAFNVIKSLVYPALLLNGRRVRALELSIVSKDEILYLQNMLDASDYVIYKLKKGVNHLDQADGETAVRFDKLPSSIRDEIHQEAPNTRDADVFFLSYYG